MKSICERFEFQPEIGIYDTLSKRYITLTGEIIQIKGLNEVRLSEQSLSEVKSFINEINLESESVIKNARQERLKSNFHHEFSKVLNEGYE